MTITIGNATLYEGDSNDPPRMWAKRGKGSIIVYELIARLTPITKDKSHG